MSKTRNLKQNQGKAIRVYNLRFEGIPVSEVARLVDCKPSQVRSLQLLGERLINLEPTQ